MVLGNQGWTIGPLTIGQVVSWINDASAVVLVLGRFHGRRWPLGLIGAALICKLATVVPAIAPEADLGFDVALGALFCAAGAVIVSRRPGLAYRQLAGMALISIPLMLLQMSGLAAWSEALNTENVAAAGEPSPAILVSEAELRYRTSQARPASFTHSNNFLSLLAGFALVLHFSCIRTARLTRRDLIICTFAVLTMAKIVLLLFIVVLAWKLITGLPMERRRMVRVALFAGLLLAGYAVIFPGLLANNISVYKISYSFFIRANDLADLLPANNPVRVMLQNQLAGTPRADWENAVTLSGYAQIVSILPYAVVGVLLMAPVFYKGFRRVRRRYPELIDMTVLTLFLVILYPTAVPFFRAQIYWFVAGFALLPLFTVWEPRRFFPPAGELLHGLRRTEVSR